MRNMLVISQHELQHVSSRRKNDFNLRLPVSQVEMLRIVRNRPVHSRQLRIDQQVVMTRSRLLNARRGHSHPAKANANLKSRRDRHSIARGVKVNDHSWRRGRALCRILSTCAKSKSPDADESGDEPRKDSAESPSAAAALFSVPRRNSLGHRRPSRSPLSGPTRNSPPEPLWREA